MNSNFEQNPESKPENVSVCNVAAAADRSRIRLCLLFLLLIVICFSLPLWELVKYSLSKELHSHIVMIPFISAWLLHLRMGKLSSNYFTAWKTGLAFFACGSAALIWSRYLPDLSRNDYLSLTTTAFLLFAMIGPALFLGSAWLRAAAFPVCFLAFMIPLPDFLVQAMESASQHGSADAAAGFFRLAGTPYLREGDVFSLPGIDPIQVAPECSGIRSSWVLFITCLLAGNLFLTSRWTRILLALVVIPLGLIRNGFRVATISWLCMKHGMEMIDSWIHHRGGPVFFALSLVPLGIIVILLRRREAAQIRKRSQ